MGVARADRPHDHEPVPAARRLARLLARAVHDGRRLRPRRHGVLRAAVGPRAGSTAPTGSSTGARSTRRRSRISRSSTSTWTTRCHTIRYPFADGDGRDGISDRDRAAGDDPRRRRRRRASGRRALPGARRPRGRRAVRRAARAGHRGRAHRAGVRHRRAEGHAGPRPGGLRDRARRTGSPSRR